jgi:hypothetical protein
MGAIRHVGTKRLRAPKGCIEKCDDQKMRPLCRGRQLRHEQGCDGPASRWRMPPSPCSCQRWPCAARRRSCWSMRPFAMPLMETRSRRQARRCSRTRDRHWFAVEVPPRAGPRIGWAITRNRTPSAVHNPPRYRRDPIRSESQAALVTSTSTSKRAWAIAGAVLLESQNRGMRVREEHFAVENARQALEGRLALWY